MAAASVSEARPPRARSAGGAAQADRRARGSQAAVTRVHWGRLGRLAMLAVLIALLYLYLSAGIHMLSTWGQARRDRADVVTMEREHERLVGQRETLGRRGTLEVEARRLGMIKASEQPYIVSGLPKN